MQRTSAPNIGEAPLPQRARSYWKTRFSAFHGELEKLLEAERAQLPRHIAAVVAFAMLLTHRLLALSERLALRFNLVLVSAGVAAAAGIAYTILTGAQAPRVRSCVAAILVLAGIALGRDAISLRLIATVRWSC